jgi:hypothetical protein
MKLKNIQWCLRLKKADKIALIIVDGEAIET